MNSGNIVVARRSRPTRPPFSRVERGTTARTDRSRFTYDATGREMQRIDPLDHRTTIGYDSAGRQNLRIDASGNLTTYVLAANVQQTGRKYPDSGCTSAILNCARVTTNTVFTESFELSRKQRVLGDLATTLVCQMSWVRNSDFRA
jgi:uncharacterized protein RhaS with RHS repeats